MKTLTAERTISGMELRYAKIDVREYAEESLRRGLAPELREVLEDGHPHRLQVVKDMRRWTNDPLDFRYGNEVHRLRCYVDTPDDIALDIEEFPVVDSELVQKQVRLRRMPAGTEWY